MAEYVSTYTPGGAFGIDVLLAARLYRIEVDKALAPLGFTYTQVEPLFLLERSHPVYHRTVANALYVAPATLVPILDRLEGRGFVTRTPDPANRRHKLVVITRQGAAFALTCRRELKSVADRFFANITMEELSYANYAVARLKHNLLEPSSIRPRT